MILDNKRHPRTDTFMEFNPEPIEPKNFFNPSIQDMLNNPQCIIQKFNPVYLDDEPENVPDNWNDDVQNIYEYNEEKPKQKKTESADHTATNDVLQEANDERNEEDNDEK